MRFCPKCGKKGIKGDFCSNCYQEESGLEFRDIEAIKCVECERYFVKNKWKHYENDDAGIIETALVKIKNPRRLNLEIKPVYKELQTKPGLRTQMELDITVDDQQFMIPAAVFVKACTKCSKKGTQYFEGILQLRDMNKELENFVRADLAAAEIDGVHIAKQQRVKDRWDIWLTSKKYMRQLGKKLLKHFTGELTESATLHTRNKQTSKDVYRLNVLFKLRKYKIGDVIDYRGSRVKIKTVGKRISGVDVDTGKKMFVEE